MSEKLLPCPFCHDSAYPQDSNPYSKRGYWAVICSNCEAEGPAANNELDAVALWNRRSDMAAVLADVAPTEAELKSANYLNEISGPGFMHRQHLAPINALVQRILAAWNRRELESASQPGGGEADTVMLPKEPTPEMQQAGALAIRFDTTVLNKLWTGNAVYRAMVAAYRAAPSAGNGGAEG